MRFYSAGLSILSIAALVSLTGTHQAAALSTRECAVKYRAAQGAGTLGAMTWQQFRKAQCGPGAAPAAAGNPTLALQPGAVFPQGIAPKYTKESPGKARLLTCLDQYRANKASNGNGGLRWVAKGGGYYSECNKRLKG